MLPFVPVAEAEAGVDVDEMELGSMLENVMPDNVMPDAVPLIMCTGPYKYRLLYVWITLFVSSYEKPAEFASDISMSIVYPVGFDIVPFGNRNVR